MRVAIYIRVSTTYQIDRDSLPMQRQDLINYSRYVLNNDNYEIFEDAGYSGKNVNRPQFQRMMDSIRTGEYSHLLVWKIDRISRNLIDFANMYRELKDRNVVFVSKNEQFDTSTAMGEAMLKIILIFAELERNITSERVTATMISRATNGQWNGGRIPFGYDYDPDSKAISINESEADIVRKIHDEYEKTRSLILLTRWMNDNNYRSRSGGLWQTNSLLNILHSRFYCGEYEYNKNKAGVRGKPKPASELVTIKAHHPAIVTTEQKDRIIASLTDNRRRYGYFKGSTHVFQGLVVCGRCGKPWLSCARKDSKGNSFSTYACPSLRQSLKICDEPGISDAYIGEFVLNYILNILNAQKCPDDINCLWDLQQHLLQGEIFADVGRIAEEGLRDMYNMLWVKPAHVTLLGKRVRSSKSTATAEQKITGEIAKTQKALDRLTNLYLYDASAMTDREYVDRRSQMLDQIADLTEQLDSLHNDNVGPIEDQDFIKRASEFILAKSLDGRQYVCYKIVAGQIDHAVLKEFFCGIIDRIVVSNRRISQIDFKNGITCRFIY